MEKTRVLSNKKKNVILNRMDTYEDVCMSCIEGLWVLTISGTVATVGNYDDVAALYSFVCGKE